MLAQKTRYALGAMLYLVEEGNGDPVQLARIAETQRVPPKYLELIARRKRLIFPLCRLGERDAVENAAGLIADDPERPPDGAGFLLVTLAAWVIEIDACARHQRDRSLHHSNDVAKRDGGWIACEDITTGAPLRRLPRARLNH
jgi:hypothetical protein